MCLRICMAFCLPTCFVIPPDSLNPIRYLVFVAQYYQFYSYCDVVNENQKRYMTVILSTEYLFLIWYDCSVSIHPSFIEIIWDVCRTSVSVLFASSLNSCSSYYICAMETAFPILWFSLC